MNDKETSLFTLIAPPRNSDIEIDDPEWTTVSKLFNVNLPIEWKLILTSYGNGIFHGSGVSLTIYNPTDPKVQAYTISRHSAVKSISSLMDYKDFPFSVYPESQGLFFFGQDENAYRLFWNPIDEGCVVVYPRLEEFRVFPNHTIDSFLFQILSGQQSYVNYPEQGAAWFEKRSVRVPES